MIWMTLTQALELLQDLERESENLRTKAENDWERSKTATEESAQRYFEQSARIYDAQSAKVKDIRTKVSVFLMAHRYSR